MATYTELQGIAAGNQLLAKFTTAVAIQAEAIRNENPATTNHANRLIWAKQAYSDPQAMAVKMTWAVLAQNASATSAAILGASDSLIQTAIAAAVDVFATGS
jgi:hypothetical protein